MALVGEMVTLADVVPLEMKVLGLHEYAFAPVADSVAVDPEQIPKSTMLELMTTLGAGCTFITSESDVVPQEFVTAKVTF